MLRQNESAQKIFSYLLQTMIKKRFQKNHFGHSNSIRFFSGSEAGRNNHYNTLGISKASSRAEIKSAYYELSMVFHPDKNKGCESAARRFREISAAYEILGNYRLRSLYDKG